MTVPQCPTFWYLKRFVPSTTFSDFFQLLRVKSFFTATSDVTNFSKLPIFSLSLFFMDQSCAKKSLHKKELKINENVSAQWLHVIPTITWDVGLNTD